MELTEKQRKHLRGLAHPLNPVILVGGSGVTGGVVAETARALHDHELIKVKFGEFKEAKKEISQEIADATKSEQIGLIGNVAILYRPHPEPGKRKFSFPD